MDLSKITGDLANCPCGREHRLAVKALEIGSGLLSKTAEILKQNGFPEKLLVVTDRNALRASEGILGILQSGGFSVKVRIYDNMRTADMREVEEIEALSQETDGILAVGSGSVDDICRLAAYRTGREFAIFATAPSMDGFASDTAPITKDNFKMSYQAKQPSVIIADTKILAAAPNELKSAGFGDMIAKYIALVDWKISTLLTGEYYCEEIAKLTEEGLNRIVALADRVTEKNEETAGQIMEALVFTGIAMGFAGCSRPASGAEHIVSHFWEIKKLEQGKLSDYHGKKVGVATVMINKLYRSLAERQDIIPHAEQVDWEEIGVAYGENLAPDMMKMNNPTVTSTISPECLKEHWGEIQNIVLSILPTDEALDALMKKAGAATTAAEIDVTPELSEAGMRYHSFMRHRVTLARLLPML